MDEGTGVGGGGWMDWSNAGDHWACCWDLPLRKNLSYRCRRVISRLSLAKAPSEVTLASKSMPHLLWAASSQWLGIMAYLDFIASAHTGLLWQFLLHSSSWNSWGPVGSAWQSEAPLAQSCPHKSNPHTSFHKCQIRIVAWTRPLPCCIHRCSSN